MWRRREPIHPVGDYSRCISPVDARARLVPGSSARWRPRLNLAITVAVWAYSLSALIAAKIVALGAPAVIPPLTSSITGRIGVFRLRMIVLPRLPALFERGSKFYFCWVLIHAAELNATRHRPLEPRCPAPQRRRRRPRGAQKHSNGRAPNAGDAFEARAGTGCIEGDANLERR